MFTTLPLSTIQQQIVPPRSSGANSSCSKRSGCRNTKRSRDNRDGDDGDNHRKKGRKSTYHPLDDKCKPCILWTQSGNDPRLKDVHPLALSRHAGVDALAISQYASHKETTFHLDFHDCVCKPCHTDYLRNYRNRENTIPRWAKLKQNVYHRLERVSSTHCIYCCSSECECQMITEWGPEEWYNQDNIEIWKQYLSATGKVNHAIRGESNHVCRIHYRNILEVKASRTCSVCTSSYSDSGWKLVCSIANSPEEVCEAFSLQLGNIHFFDWICSTCSLCLHCRPLSEFRVVR